MKRLLLSLTAILAGLSSIYAQSGSSVTPLTTWYEWNVTNSGSAPGERIVAYINAPTTIGTYTGCSIVGQIIDGNGNWGYNLPTVANFSLFANFTGNISNMAQDIQTASVTLELKAVSSSPVQWALVANISANKSVCILFRMPISNGPTLTLGDYTTVNSTGTILLPSPSYQSSFSGHTAINVTNTSGATSYTLAVGGSVVATQVTVKAQGSWPDFLFSKGYQIPTLTQVKTYIDQNHHLPEVPSAEEVAKKGIDLGDMDRVLAKKVEELTLYLINKDEEIKEGQQKQADQDQKLKQQQAQIDRLSHMLEQLSTELKIKQ